jgi:hypothetical protein
MKLLVVAGCGAVGAGFAVGVVARILMRVVALAAGDAGDFSWSGSIFIPLIYAAAMLPGAIAAAITTKRWRWIALGAGSAFLLGPAVGVAAEEVGSTSGWSAIQWAAVLVASATVFATIAVVPFVTARMVDRMLGRKRAVAAPALEPAA